jgi:type I restriction enzyme, S subunit
MREMAFLEKLLDGVEVEWKQLGELEDEGFVKLGRGNVISKKDLASTPGDFPVYSSSAIGIGEFGRYGKYMFDDERITWSVDGGGRFFFRSAHKYSVTNVCGWMTVLKQDRLNTRFLYHVLSGSWERKVFDYIKKAHPSVIRDEYEIPIPCPDNPKKSLEIQAEIVRILDAMTAHTISITDELRREIELRQKQYAYYRDLLLSFPKPPTI